MRSDGVSIGLKETILEVKKMAIIRRDPFREIERWEPFGEMESLHRRMNRLFERLMFP